MNLLLLYHFHQHSWLPHLLLLELHSHSFHVLHDETIDSWYHIVLYSLVTSISKTITLIAITSVAFVASRNYTTSICIFLFFLLFTTSSLSKLLSSVVNLLISSFLSTFSFTNSSHSLCNITIFVVDSSPDWSSMPQLATSLSAIDDLMNDQ